MKLYPNNEYIPLVCIDINEQGERNLIFHNVLNFINVFEAISGGVFITSGHYAENLCRNRLITFKQAFSDSVKFKEYKYGCFSNNTLISPYVIAYNVVDTINERSKILMLACVTKDDFLNSDVDILDKKSWIYLLNETEDNFLLKSPFYNQFLSVLELDKKTDRIRRITNIDFSKFKEYRVSSIIEYDEDYQLQITEEVLNNFRTKENITPILFTDAHQAYNTIVQF